MARGSRGRAVAIGGVEALGDAELLAILLGSGRPGERDGVLAAELLDAHGDLGGVARAGLGGLAACTGMGAAKAVRVAAALELGRRATEVAAPVRVRDGGDVWRWARARLAALEHEELWVLALDGGNRLRAARRVAMGGLHGVHVGARDPLRCALREGASAFVLVHNHPSGDPNPSTEDIVFTERIAAAADVIGTPLVDHVVVAQLSYCSMAERMLMPDPSSSRRGGSS